MELRAILEKYLKLTGGKFGPTVALGDFALAVNETERIFGLLDEDYHISRYFHFSNEGGSKGKAVFSINSFPQTHVSIDKEIEEIL